MSDPPRDEAGYRALDTRCANSAAAYSKRLVAQLSEQPAMCKANFLYNAVLWGLSNLVRCTLEAGASASSCSESGTTAAMPMLCLAVDTGNSHILKQLLEAGADHSLTNCEGFTALLIAAGEGQLDCVRLLLDAGANINKRNTIGGTPLMTAIAHKHADCAKALLGASVASDLLLTDHTGRNAFHVCVLTASEECFDLLLPVMSDVDVLTTSGVLPSGEPTVPFNNTSLHIACEFGQHRMAKALLKRGADRMARDSRQWTPLMCAARGGHLACAVLLLGQPGKFKMTPVEVNASGDDGLTALHTATAFGAHEKICGVLLEAGARLDAKASTGHTPLMIAQLLHPTNAALLALLSGAGPAQPPGTVCDQCGKTAAQASVNNLKACSQCHAVRYCSVECSLAAWSGHKAACKARAAERDEATKVEVIDSPTSSL